MADIRNLKLSPVVIGFGIVFIACFVGVLIPIFVAIAGDNPARQMALPGLILLGFVLAYSRKALLLSIIILRASTELIFEQSRVYIAGHPIGVGGLINAFVIAIVVLLVLEKPHVFPRKMVALWVGFLTAALIGVFISPVKVDAIRFLLAYFSYFAMFVGAFYLVRSAEDFRFCVRIVAWSAVIPAIYCLIDIATGGGHRFDGFRVQSTFPHPNVFAFYLMVIIPLVLYLLKSGGAALATWKRWGLTAYMLLLLVMLMLTQTRGAWVGAFVFFAAYAFFIQRRYFVYLILLSFLALLVPSVQDRVLDLMKPNPMFAPVGLPENSFAWRVAMWEAALRSMEPSHYLFGYGLNSFRHYSREFYEWGRGFAAHNVYVEVLFELGVFGLLAYAWLYGRLLLWLRLMAPLDKLASFVTIALTVVFLIVSISDNMLAYLTINWYFWFIMGAACAWIMAKDKVPRETQLSAELKTHAPTQQHVAGSSL